MRSLLLVMVSALTLAACASPTAAPEKAAAPAAAAAPVVKAAPQCYSGDHGKFFAVDARTSISGVDVVCQLSSDGKSAQWMGTKSK